MSLSRPAGTGPASGYRLAWTARRLLAAVLLPVVAAMLLSWSLLDVALGGGQPVTCAQPRESAAEAGPPDAMWDMAGEPAPTWRQTVWRCRNTDCVSGPMDVYPDAARRELLAVAPDGRELLAVASDGRVLVVRDDRIVLLETPPG